MPDERVMALKDCPAYLMGDRGTVINEIEKDGRKYAHVEFDVIRKADGRFYVDRDNLVTIGEDDDDN